MKTLKDELEESFVSTSAKREMAHPLLTKGFPYSQVHSKHTDFHAQLHKKKKCTQSNDIAFQPFDAKLYTLCLLHGQGSLVPRPLPSFPIACKRREAGRGPGNKATVKAG